MRVKAASVSEVCEIIPDAQTSQQNWVGFVRNNESDELYDAYVEGSGILIA